MLGPIQSDRLAALGQQAVVDDMVKDLFQKLAEGKVTWKMNAPEKDFFGSWWMGFVKLSSQYSCLLFLMMIQADPIRPTISSSILLPTQATCQSIKALVGRIARLDHSLVPNLGINNPGPGVMQPPTTS